jgi:hypothetical protein
MAGQFASQLVITIFQYIRVDLNVACIPAAVGLIEESVRKPRTGQTGYTT